MTNGLMNFLRSNSMSNIRQRRNAPIIRNVSTSNGLFNKIPFSTFSTAWKENQIDYIVSFEKLQAQTSSLKLEFMLGPPMRKAVAWPIKIRIMVIALIPKMQSRLYGDGVYLLSLDKFVLAEKHRKIFRCNSEKDN